MTTQPPPDLSSAQVRELIDQLTATIRRELGQRQVALEERRTQLDEWRTSVEPLDHAALQAERARINIALMGLRTLFLLNGGALVALPAYTGLAPPEAVVEMDTLGLGLAAFIVGLSLAAVATVVAYVSADAHSDSVNASARHMRHTINARYAPAAQSESGKNGNAGREVEYDPRQGMGEEDERRKRSGRRGSIFAWMALGFAAASVIAFVVGARLALDAFSAEMPTGRPGVVGNDQTEPPSE